MLIGVPNSWVNFQTPFTSIDVFFSFQVCFCEVLFFCLADIPFFLIFYCEKLGESFISYSKTFLKNHILKNPLIDYVKSFTFYRLFATELDKIIFHAYPE